MKCKLPRGQYRISITSGCNMKCVYCHNEGNKAVASLTIDQIKKIIESSKDVGLEEIRLTGGDPLTHPNIYEICRMISEDYHLKISINTNGILIDKLLYMIDNGWIQRVVIGLDYFNGNISKNSPIGLSSKEILNNILKIKSKNCNVSIATVYNGDYNEIYSIVNWCIENQIRVKIIEEEKNEISEHSSIEYLQMRDKIFDDFPLDKNVDALDEMNGYINNVKIVSFFPSLCRLRRCDLCQKIQLRITSTGVIKHCIFYDNQDLNIFKGDPALNIKRSLQMPIDYHYDESLIIDKEVQHG